MDISGVKKYENYLRRQTEQFQWETTANVEDIEYLRCQEQLQEQLLTQYTQVERVIGELTPVLMTLERGVFSPDSGQKQ